MSDDPTPLQWEAATLAWTQHGYVLEVTLWLELSAALIFEESIAGVLGPSAVIQVTAAARIADEYHAHVDPGDLRITWPEQPNDVDPRQLRATLDSAAFQALARADELRAGDDKWASAFLAALRAEDSS